jgi:hypothetical protein
MKDSYSIDKITEKNLPKKSIFRENTAYSDREESMVFYVKKADRTSILFMQSEQMFA